MDWATHMSRILSTLGEDVAFTHGVAESPVTLRGVFTEPYRAAQLGVVGVTGTEPVFSVMSSDIGEVSPNDTIVRAGVTYKVKAVRPDDPSGVVHLELRRK